MNFRSDHHRWWRRWLEEEPRRLGHENFSPNCGVAHLVSVQTVGCFAWSFGAAASSKLPRRSWVREIWVRGTSLWFFDLGLETVTMASSGIRALRGCRALLAPAKSSASAAAAEVIKTTTTTTSKQPKPKPKATAKPKSPKTAKATPSTSTSTSTNRAQKSVRSTEGESNLSATPDLPGCS
ncbi:hypothetical protein CMV_018128 [Castanea mollissima]|uniref:Uncharacterized protein n=1 Tax=Castanea mollissima TaxID=60419 RepID=A0A8J4QP39_9ROSI|nr:hypothetical protein CMV_018128 [Castanea mollissima]